MEATMHAERARPAQRGVMAAMLLVLASGCADHGPDAYGHFEATEVTVSAQTGGPLLRFEAQEGAHLEADRAVAWIDTVSLGLQREEVLRQRATTEARAQEAQAQTRVVQAQLATAREDLARTERLFADTAATASDLTRMRGTVAALEPQIDVARARARVAEEELRTLDARRAQIEDQIARATVRNPIAGTVLTTFVERGELVAPGRVLYAIASLDTLELRAYVSGDQLSSLHLGGPVRVAFDGGEGSIETREGRLTWIAARAEFTPTPIQTRDERVDQVYAVKVRVPNADGRIKIGMPGELLLASSVDGGAAR